MLCRLQIEDLLSIEWHTAVFDEAHKLKNDKSATYEAAAELHGVTKRLYGLTGTIMQVPFPVTGASRTWLAADCSMLWMSLVRFSQCCGEVVCRADKRATFYAAECSQGAVGTALLGESRQPE